MMRVKVLPLAESGVPGWIQLGSGVAPLPHRLEPARRTLALPPAFLDTFGLARGQDVHVYPADEGRRLVIGPLIGIWVTPAALRSWKRGVRVLSQEARRAGAIPFFFHMDGIDRAGGRIAGWTALEDGLRRVTMPLPDVIYNRATFPDLRQRAAAREMRKALVAEDAIAFVNVASGFPKWETYQTLRFFADTRSLVPETIRFGNRDELADFLSRHGLAFIKADSGSHGTEVLRLRAVAGGWWVEGQVGERKIQTRVETFARLAAVLQRWVAGSDWVVQQGIQLPRLQGRRWDLRIEVRKDGTGQWTVPMILVRLGNPASVTTNISRGGKPFPLEDFRRRFGRQRHLEGLQEKATRVGLRVAFALEARFGSLGEIGVDMGVDPHGRPWVFEANAKPQFGPSPRSHQVRGLMEYAVHLALRSWAGRDAGMTLPAPMSSSQRFRWRGP